MDIYCPIDGEPWDFDSLHEEVDYRIHYGTLEFKQLPTHDERFKAVREDFYRRGCQALGYAMKDVPCTPTHSLQAQAASAIYDLLGDDIDGAASLLDDSGLF